MSATMSGKMTLIISQFHHPNGRARGHFSIFGADDATGFRLIDDSASTYPTALRRAADALRQLADEAASQAGPSTSEATPDSLMRE
jgi:hypothetical protein